MLAVISPAKSMDLAPSPDFVPPASEPLFAAKAQKLATQARKLKADGLASLMSLSDDLANSELRPFQIIWKAGPKARAAAVFWRCLSRIRRRQYGHGGLVAH